MRIVVAVIALVIAVAACDRVVDLFPHTIPPDASIVIPDAHHPPDAEIGNDGNDGSLVLPDAGIAGPDSSFPDA